MDPFVKELLDNGPLAIVVAGFILGWFAPKWVIDESRRREASKDAIIERQAKVIERLAGRGARIADLPADGGQSGD